MENGLKPTRYIGKVCEKHPELNGERRKANRKCVRCAAAKMMAWAKRNKEKMHAHNNASYQRHKAERKAYRDKHMQRQNAWRRANPDKINRYVMTWRKKNWDKAMLSIKQSYIRRKRLIGGQALALKYVLEIKQIYQACPKGLHVDHIVPLRGNNVCGLHVPWNLQYLNAQENKRKGNKWLEK